MPLLLPTDKSINGPATNTSASSSLGKLSDIIPTGAGESGSDPLGLPYSAPDLVRSCRCSLLPIQMKGYEAMKQRVETQIKHQGDQRTYFDASPSFQDLLAAKFFD